MRTRLFLVVGLTGFLGSLTISPVRAGDSFGLPSGLPDGWSVLNENAAPRLSPSQRGPFDFGLDGFPLPPDPSLGIGGTIQHQTRPTGSEGSSEATGRAEAPGASAQKSRARIEQLKRAEDQKRAENLKKALAPQQTFAVMRRRMLDELFAHLRAAADIDEAKGVAAAIERVWLQSPFDTANLLMQRALLSVRDQNYAIALALLDKVVALEPNWEEAWNQRATARFLTSDTDGAMADIGQVIKLEPRHFAALSGMGLILQRTGLPKKALLMFNKALEIYPLQPDLRKTVEELTIQVEGRDI